MLSNIPWGKSPDAALQRGAIVSRLSDIDQPDMNSLEDPERSWRIDDRAPAAVRTTDLPRLIGRSLL